MLGIRAHTFYTHFLYAPPPPAHLSDKNTTQESKLCCKFPIFRCGDTPKCEHIPLVQGVLKQELQTQLINASTVIKKVEVERVCSGNIVSSLWAKQGWNAAHNVDSLPLLVVKAKARKVYVRM